MHPHTVVRPTCIHIFSYLSLSLSLFLSLSPPLCLSPYVYIYIYNIYNIALYCCCRFDTFVHYIYRTVNIKYSFLQMAKPPDIEGHLKVELPSSARKKRKITDFSLCILCQENTKYPLVNPISYEKILMCIRK